MTGNREQGTLNEGTGNREQGTVFGEIPTEAGNLDSAQLDALAGAFVRLLYTLGGNTWDFTQAVNRADSLMSMQLVAVLARERAEAMGVSELALPQQSARTLSLLQTSGAGAEMGETDTVPAVLAGAGEYTQ